MKTELPFSHYPRALSRSSDTEEIGNTKPRRWLRGVVASVLGLMFLSLSMVAPASAATLEEAGGGGYDIRGTSLGGSYWESKTTGQMDISDRGHRGYEIHIDVLEGDRHGVEIQSRFINERRWKPDQETSWVSKKTCTSDCIVTGTMGTKWDRIQVRIVNVNPKAGPVSGDYDVYTYAR